LNIEIHQHIWSRLYRESIQPLLQATPGAFIHALVEGVHDESCYPMLSQAGNLRFTALYECMANADEETLGLSPLLVEYADAGASAWLSLFEKLKGKPALSIMVTEESLEALAARLKAWCVVDAADTSLALSFADTRVLPELVAVLKREQIAQLCGPALLWTYPSRAGTWMTVELPEDARPPAAAVTLNANQYAQLVDAAEADAVLFYMREHHAPLVERHGMAQAHALIRDGLRCADRTGVERIAERFDICERSLRCAEIGSAADSPAARLGWVANTSIIIERVMA
jgi:hypothetical protein